MRIGIIYHRFLDENGNERLIGGIQTYIYNLALLCVENNWTPMIFQLSNDEFRKNISGITVIGVKQQGNDSNKNIARMYSKASNELNINDDIIIFGADHCSIKTDNPRAISIQHGISWDMPINKLRPNALFVNTRIGGYFWKERLRRTAIKRFDNCQKRVCVDYNFLNWYKTMISGEISGDIWVIPNFSNKAKVLYKATHLQSDDLVKIIFARRFTEYRGSRLMSDAIQILLKQYDNIEFTLAGEGPDEKFLEDLFKDNNKVKFIKYLPNEVLEVLSHYDISIVPSLASEGTSLSVAESMSAGCATVATAVGGITNMIIDGYNGYMISPNVEELCDILRALIDDPHKRIDVSNRGQEVFEHSFTIDRWKLQWVKVIESLDKNTSSI